MSDVSGVATVLVLYVKSKLQAKKWVKAQEVFTYLILYYFIYSAYIFLIFFHFVSIIFFPSSFHILYFPICFLCYISHPPTRIFPLAPFFLSVCPQPNSHPLVRPSIFLIFRPVPVSYPHFCSQLTERTSQLSVEFCHTTRRNIPQDGYPRFLSIFSTYT